MAKTLIDLGRELETPEDWLDSSWEEGWQYYEGFFRVKKLAQEQMVVEFNLGSGPERVKGLSSLSKDAQSDVTYEISQKHPVFVAALIEKYRRQMHPWADEEFSSEPKGAIVVGDSSSDDDPDGGYHQLDETAAELTADRLYSCLLEHEQDKYWTKVRELVFLAEDTDFTPDQSELLAPRLIEIAFQHRDSNDPQDKPAVWSAIRTGASMLPPDDVHKLRPLLKPGHAIDTTLVTVKMLGRIFEAQPPMATDQHPEIAGDVRQIAEALLNPYVIESSQSAAKAQLAIYALVAIASSDSPQIIATARSLGQPWFILQMVRDLRELREYWDKLPSAVAAEPREILTQAINELSAE
jgi:hypothetical protein